jgi:hypothetical protein
MINPVDDISVFFINIKYSHYMYRFCGFYFTFENYSLYVCREKIILSQNSENGIIL